MSTFVEHFPFKSNIFYMYNFSKRKGDILKSCIFIAGVHGVGKTTFSQQLQFIMNYPYYSASKLIKDFNVDLFFANKRVTDVGGNQDVLISSIEQSVAEDFFILDGHFTLMKENNSVEKIPYDTFKKLNIKKTILLLEHPNIIFQRISNRENKYLLSINEIEELQKQELKHARDVCFTQKIPLIILNNSEEARDFLKKENIS